MAAMDSFLITVDGAEHEVRLVSAAGLLANPAGPPSSRVIASWTLDRRMQNQATPVAT